MNNGLRGTYELDRGLNAAVAVYRQAEPWLKYFPAFREFSFAIDTLGGHVLWFTHQEDPLSNDGLRSHGFRLRGLLEVMNEKLNDIPSSEDASIANALTTFRRDLSAVISGMLKGVDQLLSAQTELVEQGTLQRSYPIGLHPRTRQASVILTKAADSMLDRVRQQNHVMEPYADVMLMQAKLIAFRKKLKESLSFTDEKALAESIARLEVEIEGIEVSNQEMDPQKRAAPPTEQELKIFSALKHSLTASTSVMREAITDAIVDLAEDRFQHPASNFSEAAIFPLPPSPPPATGTRFAVVDGKLDFRPPDLSDIAKTDLARLEVLLPVQRTQVYEALELFGRNKSQPRIHSVLERYAQSLEGDTQRLNFDLIAAYGILIANAETASQRQIADRLLPELEDPERAALTAILDLHGPIILSTESGRSLLSDVATYNQTAEEQAAFKNASIELVEAIKDDGFASDRTSQFLTDASESIGQGIHPERSAYISRNAFRNISTTIVLGGSLTALLGVSTTIKVLASLAFIVLGEGFKKSQPGQKCGELGT